MTVHRVDQTTTGEQFAQQGWLHVPSLGVSPAEVAEARALMDGLFDRFGSLPKRYAADLGGGSDPHAPVLPEILDVSTLAPALRRTALYRSAHRLARQLLGPDAFLIYDHAIYKPPGRAGTTSWHQDSGFDPDLTNSLAVWVPFQDTAVVDGAMRYVPQSHLGGPRPHLTRTTADGKEVKHLLVDDADAVDVPCLVGGATVHDLHMVHGAGPNLGTNVRRAWILDFATAPPLRRAARGVKFALRSRFRPVLAR